MDISAATLKDIIAVTLSVAALVLSYRTAIRASRLNQAQLKLAKLQGEADTNLAAVQAELVREQTRLARDSDIIRWAGDTIALLSEMAELPMLAETSERRTTHWHELRHRLSSQIDIGRLFFPNFGTDLVDTERSSAYRGRRQPVLDHLVAAYDIFDEALMAGDTDARRQCKRRIIRAKRHFVSEIEGHIDPNRYIEALDPALIDGLKEEIATKAAQEEATNGKAVR